MVSIIHGKTKESLYNVKLIIEHFIHSSIKFPFIETSKLEESFLIKQNSFSDKEKKWKKEKNWKTLF